MNKTKIDSTIDDIDSVLGYLENHREQAATRLFPLGDTYGSELYLNSWAELSPIKFWQRLDLANRRELIRLAREFYA